MRDYHIDRDRGVYITSAGWNRSPFTTDAFRYATDSFRYAFEVLQDSQLLRDIWESCMWNGYSNEDKETNIKEIKAADNDKVDEFLA